MRQVRVDYRNLVHLDDRLSNGGRVIVAGDYQLESCRAAVHYLCATLWIKPPLFATDRVGYCLQKTS